MNENPINELVPTSTAPRLDRLREGFDKSAIDTLIVTKLENIRYLTGFSGSAGTLVIGQGGATLITDGRYRDQSAAQIQASGAQVEIEIAGAKAAFDALEAAVGSAPRVGLEADSVTWSQKRRIHERLSEVELVATTGLVEHLRLIKDDGELARIERACDIASAALEKVKARLTDHITELEFAAELEFAMSTGGSSEPAFSTIVGSGPNGAMPHAHPTDRRIESGDLVVVDFGATVDGYRSDMTRTFAVGAVDAELISLLEAVLESQQAGVDAVHIDTTGANVDEICRESLQRAGYGELFTHSTGHGVGLEIHEPPWVASGSEDVLGRGTIVTVEPGAYIAGRGGVRIEDTVVVTDSGARALTKFTKDYVL